MGSDDIGSLKGYNIRIEGLEITDDLPVINDRNRISQSTHGYDLINVVLSIMRPPENIVPWLTASDM